jgi:hypothetical protein
MDEILADYNEAELELLAGFLQKVTAAGVIAAALSDRGDAVASGTASADRTACPPTLHIAVVAPCGREIALCQLSSFEDSRFKRGGAGIECRIKGFTPPAGTAAPSCRQN